MLEQMNGFVPITDVERARAFYEGILGFKLVDDNPYVATFRSNGTNIYAQKSTQVTPEHRTILGWEVTDIESTVKELGKRGVEFMRVEFLKQDELGIWDSGGGKVAWFKDPDGNTLSISQH